MPEATLPVTEQMLDELYSDTFDEFAREEIIESSEEYAASIIENYGLTVDGKEHVRMLMDQFHRVFEYVIEELDFAGSKAAIEFNVATRLLIAGYLNDTKDVFGAYLAKLMDVTAENNRPMATTTIEIELPYTDLGNLLEEIGVTA